MAISLNKSEVNEVKKLSKKLVDKWSREIFEIENNYTRLEEIERYQNRP